MTTTVSESALRELASYRARNGCAVSIYVDLDPSSTPTIPGREKRFHALLDAAQKEAEHVAAGRGRDCRLALRDDLARIRAWWGSELGRGGARGVAIFASSEDDFFRTLQLASSAGDAVHVGSGLLVSPVAGQFSADGTLVAFVSRERGTLYRVQAGRLVELLDESEEQPRRHNQGGWSQARYQRHIDNLVQQHLKAVGAQLDRVVRQPGPGLGVVVVAPEEARAELERELSYEARRAIIGSTSAEAHAGPTELLSSVQPFIDEARARAEQDALERWEQAYRRRERSAAGWKQVLDAASDGRVEVLLLQEGVNRQVWECPACARASADGGKCPVDGTRLEEAKDGADLAVHQTLAHGGGPIRLGAGALPDGLEIAALLRY
jgi:peptide chain release factor subunit 1